jgi:hypothetical protein
MAIIARSFCELDLTPALELVLRPWPQTLRNHAARCPACALRMDALERLAARIEPQPALAAPMVAERSRKRARSSRLMSAVLAPIRRTAAVAALGVGAMFLGLVVGGGMTLGLAVVSDRVGVFQISQALASTTIAPSHRLTAEDIARELAAHGSLTPLPLLP